MGDGLLGHGGAVGAAFEIGFILVPIIIFAILAVLSKRKDQPAEADEAGTAREDGGEVA